MNKRYLLIVFYSLLAFAFLSSAVSFVSWNMPRKINVSLNGDNSEIRTNIDSCVIDNKRIVVSGWAAPLSSSDRYFGKTFIAIKSNDELYKIRTERVDRPDLVRAYKPKGNISASGFIARSRYGLFKGSISKEIYIITEFKGKSYASKYLCK